MSEKPNVDADVEPTSCPNCGHFPVFEEGENFVCAECNHEFER